jgi:hypothetical protein
VLLHVRVAHVLLDRHALDDAGAPKSSSACSARRCTAVPVNVVAMCSYGRSSTLPSATASGWSFVQSLMVAFSMVMFHVIGNGLS